MIIGEVANFVAYTYAPAVLVTPLGALSIIVRCTGNSTSLPVLCWLDITLPSNLTAFLANLDSAFLAHFMLKEHLQKMGVIGCVCCIVGSVVIVIHAPEERTPSSVLEIWDLATQPGLLDLSSSDFVFRNLTSSERITNESFFLLPSTAFLIYVGATISTVLALVLYFEPRYGQRNMLVYLGICSLMGSLTVTISHWVMNCQTLCK